MTEASSNNVTQAWQYYHSLSANDYKELGYAVDGEPGTGTGVVEAPWLICIAIRACKPFL